MLKMSWLLGLISICYLILIAPTAVADEPHYLVKKCNASKLCHKSEHFRVQLSGFVNQAANYANDGNQGYLFFGNNSNYDSRFTIASDGALTDDLTLLSNITIGLRNTPTSDFSQTNQNPTSTFNLRIAEVSIDSKRLGRLTLGQGYPASYSATESDLSETDIISYPGSQYNGGSLFFRDTNTGQLSTVTAKSVINSLDGLPLTGRIRYATPKFAGFTLLSSLLNTHRYDVALNFNRKFSWAHISADTAYTSTSNIKDTTPGRALGGSISILLNNGLNITAAGSQVFTVSDVRSDPYYYYLKLGYLANLTQIGKTAFSVNCGHFYNYVYNKDHGILYGATINQHIEKFNSEIYVHYNNYNLHRSNANFKPINLVTVGIRVRF